MGASPRGGRASWRSSTLGTIRDKGGSIGAPVPSWGTAGANSTSSNPGLSSTGGVGDLGPPGVGVKALGLALGVATKEWELPPLLRPSLSSGTPACLDGGWLLD